MSNVLFDNGTHKIESAGTNNPVDNKSYYSLDNASMLMNGSAAIGQGNSYYGEVGATVDLNVSIIDEAGDVQAQLDGATLGYPAILKIPVVKFVGGANGTQTDEIYFNATLTAGILRASGTIPASGNWKLLITRINEAIAAVDDSWAVTGSDTTILV